MYDETTALHEAGHAVVADALGHEVSVVTVESGERFSGCAVYRPRPFSAAARPSADRPLLTWGAGWQHHLATTTAVTLAGGMSESMFAERATGRVPDPADALAADLLARLAGASDAEREQASRAANDLSLPGDAEAVAWTVYLAHDRDQLRAQSWLWWLTEETRALLLLHERAVRRLSGLLRLEGTLGREAVAACLRERS